MKALKTEHPGIYQIGKNYYIDFYGNGKRHRKVAGPNLKKSPLSQVLEKIGAHGRI